VSNQLKFALVFVIVNLHVLRNISLPLYLMFYGPLSLYLLFQFMGLIASRVCQVKAGLIFVWVVVGLLGLWVSLAVISPMGAFAGLGRFLFAIPIFFALCLYTEGMADLRKHLQTYVAFFVVAALTVPLQFVIGPISWFADTSTRAGFDRYSSLLGSLTSIGIVVGAYVILTQPLNPVRRWIYVILMAFPAVVSLNKSAIANVAIAVLVIIYLNRRSLSKLVAGLLSAITLLAIAYGSVPAVQGRIDAVLVSFGLSGGTIVNYDVTVSESLWDRLYSLPLANFEVLAQLGSPFVYITGGGFGMASTALVPPGDSLAPMAHNQYAELLTVFGVMGGCIALACLGIVAHRLRVLYLLSRNDIVLAVGASLGLLLMNSLFANGTFYQPSSASLLFLAMFVSGVPLSWLDQRSDVVHVDPRISR
jgi:hypothetical protein